MTTSQYIAVKNGVISISWEYMALEDGVMIYIWEQKKAFFHASAAKKLGT